MGCIEVDSVTTHWQDRLTVLPQLYLPSERKQRYKCMKKRKKKQTNKLKQGLIKAIAIIIL